MKGKDEVLHQAVHALINLLNPIRTPPWSPFHGFERIEILSSEMAIFATVVK